MFRLISELLTPLGLHNPTLEILLQDAALYNTLLIQPGGQIDYGDDFIRTIPEEETVRKFAAFFSMAHQKGSALAVTPEYSCPTSVIESLLQDNLLPAEHKIWIIGGQSIKARELHEFKEANTQVSWITEEELITDNLNNELFFNPVYYIFKSRTKANNILRTIVLVQFKTHHLGGSPLEWERDHLIFGNSIYVIENRTESSRLVTINCADIFNAAVNIANLPQFVNTPYLIVHIQLNPFPNNDGYRAYRGNTYNMGRETKEFICLNWARNLNMRGIQPWNAYGGSALYIKAAKPNDINLGDDRLTNNDLKGLYYTRWTGKYADVFFFNYEESIFEYRNTKVSQETAGPAVRKRSGPEMLHAYSWDNEANNWEIKQPVDPGFAEVCGSFNALGDYATIRSLCGLQPIDVERIVYLSVGKAIEANWHHPRNLSFFSIDDNEIIERITFTQNPDLGTRERRRQHLLHYGKLEYRVINNDNNLPDAISDLRGNCQIGYRLGQYRDKYHLNLFPRTEEGVPATGIYIGERTLVDAEDILIKMMELFKLNEDGKRVVVWYLDENNDIQKTTYGRKAKITDNPSKSNRIASKGKRK